MYVAEGVENIKNVEQMTVYDFARILSYKIAENDI
jgi:hypothetical protein